jgi:hypothetical protein
MLILMRWLNAGRQATRDLGVIDASLLGPFKTLLSGFANFEVLLYMRTLQVMAGCQSMF